MPELPARSVYLSESQGMDILSFPAEGASVFLSLHREEEMDDSFKDRAEVFCRKLSDRGFRIIADLSKRTEEVFHAGSAGELMDLLSLDAVRLDYGYEKEEILTLAEKRRVILNASTLTAEEMKAFSGNENISVMHNFYPRPETGLEEDQLKELTDRLHAYGFRVSAFIPGTGRKRGPLHQGLPTLENHRAIPPYAAFADLIVNYGMDRVFIGDPEIEKCQWNRMVRFAQEGILEIPCLFKDGYQDLQNRVFTCRPDSPKSLIRLAESREYSVSSGKTVTKHNTEERLLGSITMDNERYLRYCGEVMIARRNFPKDEKVNVIGQVSQRYLTLLDCVKNGGKFTLVMETE